MKIETKAIHLGHETDLATGAVVPPLYLATTYERDGDGTYPRGYVYSRLGQSQSKKPGTKRCPYWKTAKWQRHFPLDWLRLWLSFNRCPPEIMSLLLGTYTMELRKC